MSAEEIFIASILKKKIVHWEFDVIYLKWFQAM
jgi:hypothetical protein